MSSAAHAVLTTASHAAATAAGQAATLPTRLDPSNDEAREWLRRELAKPAYRDTRDPIQRAFDAVQQWLSDLISNINGPAHPLPTIVAALVTVALLALAIFALRFVRRTTRAPGLPEQGVLSDRPLTAEQYRARATRALTESRYAACVLDALRAIARGAVERTLLEDSPALTAHEIASRLAVVFPTQGSDLRWAADRFDAVAYGEDLPTREEAERLLALDTAVAHTRPGRSSADSRAAVGAVAP